MLKIAQYPRNADGTPMDLEVGVLTDASGNGGARLATPPIGPDGSPIDAKGLVLTDSGGTPVDLSALPKSVATRNEMGALGSGYAFTYLREAGREGAFTWVAGNLSALVAADTAQGIYVASAADPTGVTGAWVRKFTGWVDARWFGAKADYNGITGTDNAAAFAAMTAVVQALSVNAPNVGGAFSTIYRGGPTLYFPGWYYTSGTNGAALDILSTCKIKGDGGIGLGAPSRISCAAGITGVRTQAQNTSGDSTVDGVAHYAGSWIQIEDIQFIGAYDGTNAGPYHGLHHKHPVVTRNAAFIRFQGSGHYCDATAGGGSPDEGNANSSRFYNTHFLNNGISGSNIDDAFGGGADTNNFKFDACHFNGNTQYGVDDHGFLGNTYDTCHFMTNGAGWMRTTNANALHAVRDCYCEGDQPAGSLSPLTRVEGGELSAGYTGGVTINTALVNDISAVRVIPQLYLTTTGAFGDFFINSVGQQRIRFQLNAVDVAAIVSADSALYHQVNAGFSHIFQVGGVSLATLDATQFNIGAIPFKVGGTTVIDAARNGVFAKVNSPRVETGSGTATSVLFALGTDNYFAAYADSGGVAYGPLHIRANEIFLEYQGVNTATVRTDSIDLAAGKSLKFNGTVVVDSARNGSFASVTATGTVTGSNLSGTNTGDETAVTTQAGTAYTAVLTDAHKYIRFTNGAAITFTIPPNSAVAFPINTTIELEQAGAGALSLAAGAGVTINSRGGDLTLAGQYAVAAVKKVAADTWTLTGDL